MAKKLKVLFLVPSFPSLTETFIINQIIDLLDRGHDVNIFSLTRGKSLIHQKVKDYNLISKTTFADVPTNVFKRVIVFMKKLINSDGINRRKLIKSLNLFKYGMSALTLSSFFKVSWLTSLPNDFDIVHAHFGFMYSYYFRAKECGFLLNASLITTFHGYDMVPADLLENQRIYKELFDNNILITTNNEYGKSLLHLIRQDYSNISLLPVALDTTYYSPNSSKASNKYINVLFCGRLIRLKGPKRVVEVANNLINHKHLDNVKFTIIGDGPKKYIDEINLLINEYGLNDKVTLAGPLEQKEIIVVLNTTDIFIMPGITDVDGKAENQGLVIQEAQAMQVPVVVTDAGGMKYGLDIDRTGFVVEENDLDIFAEKVQFLIQNPQQRNEMGVEARKFVQRHFDSKVIGTNLEQLYYKIKQKNVL